MQLRRSVAMVVAVSLVGGCASDRPASVPAGGDPPASASPPSSTDSTDAAGVDDADHLAGFGRSMEGVGITLVDDLADSTAVDALSTYELASMAAEQAAGGGVPGSLLDELAPQPEGAPPFSYVLAGWMAAADTPRSNLARSWYPDDVDWSQAPRLVVPRAVLFLFEVDVAADLAAAGTALDADQSFGDGAGAAPAGLVRSARAADACAVVGDFLAGKLGALFDAIKISPQFLGTGFFETIGTVLAAAWNFAVSIAGKVIGGLVTSLTAEVVSAIGFAVSVVGVVEKVMALIAGWHPHVRPDPPLTITARGSEPDIEGTFVADEGERRSPIPADVLTCAAQLASLPTPSMFAPGAKVTWAIDRDDAEEAGVALIARVDADAAVGADHTATFTYRTGRQEDVPGVEKTGRGVVRVSVPTTLARQMVDFAKGALSNTVAQLSSGVGGDLRSSAEQSLNDLLQPVLDNAERSLTKTASGDGADLLIGEARATVYVSYLVKDDTTTLPPETTEPPRSTAMCDVMGAYQTWFEAEFDLADASVVPTIIDFFAQMVAAAPPAMKDIVARTNPYATRAGVELPPGYNDVEGDLFASELHRSDYYTFAMWFATRCTDAQLGPVPTAGWAAAAQQIGFTPPEGWTLPD